MRYLDDDHPEWNADERAFKALRIVQYVTDPAGPSSEKRSMVASGPRSPGSTTTRPGPSGYPTLPA
ncbi:hypothetical protein [Sphingopyxis panaciterrae]